MNRTAPLLDRLLDEQALSLLVGRPVAVGSVRAKPGTLLVLGLVDPAARRPVGWARVLWPSARDKAEKTTLRAQRRGLRLVERGLADGLLLQAGRIDTDPGLANAVRRARPRRLRDLVLDAGTVLRHNPLRRVLVRDGEAVVRIAAAHDPLARPLLLRLAALGLPVPAVLDDGDQPLVSSRRFFGDGDLLGTPSAEGVRWAGETLARVHAATDAVLADGRVAGWLRPRRPGCVPEDTLGSLDPALGAWFDVLADRLLGRPALPGPDVVLHGDASADQVLVDTARGARQLNDFDRAALGPAALDLGSWLAVDRLAGVGLGEEFLAGYARGGGVVPDAAALTTALAHGLLSRVTAPVREGNPDWRVGVAARLDDLAEVLA